ncbi:MAG: hypothetical protein ACI4KG_02585 [Oscillospiraceae bacterium]
MTNKKLYNILLYLVKVAILFLILFFTFIEPTGLTFLLLLAMPVYALLYLGTMILLAEFPRQKRNGGFFRRHILPVITLLLGVGAIFIVYFLGLELKEKLLTVHINNFAKKAEEIIPYDTSYYHMDGMLGTDFMHSVIMIDYDTKTVAFLYGDLPKYKEFKLSSGTVQDKSMLQLTAELSSPGEALTTYYYKDKSYSHLTTSIMLTMEDGTVYSISGLEKDDNDFLSLNCETISLADREEDYLIKNRTFSEIYNGKD